MEGGNALASRSGHHNGFESLPFPQFSQEIISENCVKTKLINILHVTEFAVFVTSMYG
jgi:hypothetical protein